MASREQRGDREKKKPKAERTKRRLRCRHHHLHQLEAQDNRPTARLERRPHEGFQPGGSVRQCILHAACSFPAAGRALSFFALVDNHNLVIPT